MRQKNIWYKSNVTQLSALKNVNYRKMYTVRVKTTWFLLYLQLIILSMPPSFSHFGKLLMRSEPLVAGA